MKCNACEARDEMMEHWRKAEGSAAGVHFVVSELPPGYEASEDEVMASFRWVDQAVGATDPGSIDGP